MSSEFDKNEPDYDVVHKASDGVWTYLTNFLFDGLYPVGNRSIIYLIPHLQSLVIVNPAELSPGLIDQIKALEVKTDAKVRYLLSPGDWHYLYIGAYLKYFKEATVYVPPGRIPSKEPDFAFQTYNTELSNPLPEFLPTLSVFTFRGMAAYQDPTSDRWEYLYYHYPSRSLTSGDSIYYSQLPAEEAGIKLGRVYGHVRFHHWGWKTIKSVKACKWTIDTLLEKFGDVERYIPPHGKLGNMKIEGVKEDLLWIRDWLDRERPEGWEDVGTEFVEPK
ncbi:hypothetical protein BC937DRAFT_95543 [Endogone sp. FLAS-F59071]|nr:hypothetical protein BC937DRAFT_95543 [Endogone sp. FLAS-F59071]|eukprot:RUS13297.1 hypothetical protein BC937DRAFT_95543 [Endogone sp. FLAS-F59071]